MSNYPALEKIKTLIQSLSPYQRRDFKRYADYLGGRRGSAESKNKHKSAQKSDGSIAANVPPSKKNLQDKKGARYVQLFDAFIEVFKKKEFPKNFYQKLTTQDDPVGKDVAGILYDKILESQRFNPETRKMKVELMGQIADIRFLMDNSLWSDAMNLLEKASEQAKSFDYPLLSLDLLSLKKEVLIALSGDFLDQLLEIKDREAELLKRLEQDRAIYELNLHVLQRMVKGESYKVREDTRRLLDDWHQRYQQKDDTWKMPFHTERRLLLALINDIDWKGTLESGEKPRLWYAKQLTALYESKENKEFKTEEPDMFLEHVGLLLSISSVEPNADRASIFEQYKPQFEQFKGTNAFYRHAPYHYLMFYANTRNYAVGKEFLDQYELDKDYIFYAEKLNPSRLMTFSLYAALICWATGDMVQAERWFDRLIHPKQKDYRPDIQCIARVHYRLLQVDQGFFDKYSDPEALLRGDIRWANGQKLQGKEYTTLWSLLRLTVNEPKKFVKNPNLPKLLQDLENAIKSSPEKFGSYQTMVRWYEAKMQGLSLGEMLTLPPKP